MSSVEFVDLHAHLFESRLPVMPAEAVANAQAAGVVQLVIPGIDLPTSRQAIEIAGQFPGVCFPTVGIHPHAVLSDRLSLQASMDELRTLLDLPIEKSEVRSSKFLPRRQAGETNPNSEYRKTKRRPDSSAAPQNDIGIRGIRMPFEDSSRVTGIGEIGIDYHHYDRDQTRAAQREAFAAQLTLAVEYNLPAIVHGREAYSDVLDVIKAHPGSRGVLHSFEASISSAYQAFDLGWIVSFTALVTYPGYSWLREVVARIPIDRFTVETDSPYLPPQSRRTRYDVRGTADANQKLVSRNSKLAVGKRGVNNQPAYVLETAQTIADLRGISLDALAEATTATARSYFQLPTV